MAQRDPEPRGPRRRVALLVPVLQRRGLPLEGRRRVHGRLLRARARQLYRCASADGAIRHNCEDTVACLRDALVRGRGLRPEDLAVPDLLPARGERPPAPRGLPHGLLHEQQARLLRARQRGGDVQQRLRGRLFGGGLLRTRVRQRRIHVLRPGDGRVGHGRVGRRQLYSSGATMRDGGGPTTNVARSDGGGLLELLQSTSDNDNDSATPTATTRRTAATARRSPATSGRWRCGARC